MAGETFLVQHGTELDEMSLRDALVQREHVTKHLIAQLRDDEKDHAIVLITAFMSIDDLEYIARFWDNRKGGESRFPKRKTKP